MYIFMEKMLYLPLYDDLEFTKHYFHEWPCQFIAVTGTY